MSIPNNLRLTVIILSAVLLSCKKQNKETPVTPPSADKTLSAFNINVAKNSGLLQDITGDIEGDTVFVSTFSGTTINSLIPEFTFKGSSVAVGGTTQVSGVTANDFSKNISYNVKAADGSTKTYIVKLTDTGLPTIYINTTNNAPIVNEVDYLPGTVKIAGDITGNILLNTTMTIKGRGNSTWTFPKKPYHLKLDAKASLFGMPSNKSWVLLANYDDKSLMRNELAFTLARQSGLAFTTGSQFVELVLNGVYEGNYQLTQKIDQGKNQVNVESQASGATALPDITGGYLIQEDGFNTKEDIYFSTSRNMPISVAYPDPIDATQLAYITTHVQKFEDALYAPNFADTVSGYRQYLDVDSYIDNYIVNEVMGNSDIFWSAYMYKKRNDDKLYSGPVWDFDIAANNDNRIGDAVNKLMFDVAFEPKVWINQLMQDPAFRQRIRSRWNELKTNIFALPPVVDQIAKKLSISQQKNFIRWPILNQSVYLNLEVAGTYDGEVKYLKNYLTNRISWLDAKFNSSDYQ